MRSTDPAPPDAAVVPRDHEIWKWRHVAIQFEPTEKARCRLSASWCSSYVTDTREQGYCSDCYSAFATLALTAAQQRIVELERCDSLICPFEKRVGELQAALTAAQEARHKAEQKIKEFEDLVSRVDSQSLSDRHDLPQ